MTGERSRSPSGRPPSERRARRRRWALLVVALVVLVLGAIALEIVRIRRDLEAGRAILANLELAKLDRQGGLEVVVGRAASHLDAADARARGSLVLRAVGLVPVLGNQVDGLRDLTGAIKAIGDAGRGTAATIQGAIDAGSGPDRRVAIARTASAELAKIREVVRSVDVGDRWLLPPLERARHDLAQELAEADGELDRASKLVAALEGFLIGPRRYLMLGGNNAEMRSGGIATTSGIATIADGAIQMGRFRGSDAGVELEEPGVPVPEDYRRMYGWLNGHRGYRTATATANWPVAAQIMADITARNRYGPVDGIIYVDTVTLAVLLNVIGPVEVDGVEYTGDNVLEELLYRHYLQYRTVDDNRESQQVQGAVANAVFDAIEQRDYSITHLAGVLSSLARTRHLLAWSADPEENELWVALGADGALHQDTIGAVSQELGASKLDYFVRMEVDLESRLVDFRHHVTMRVRLTNLEHGETSPYIDGGGFFAEPGEYGSFLVFYLPKGAETIANVDPGFGFSAPDGDTFAAGMLLRVPEGTTREIEVTFTLPLRPDDTLTVLPTARIAPTKWNVGGETRDDRNPIEIRLTETGAEFVDDG